MNKKECLFILLAFKENGWEQMEQEFTGSLNRWFEEKYLTALVIVLELNFEDKNPIGSSWNIFK